MVHGRLAALLEKCRRIISETKASRLTQNHHLKHMFDGTFPIDTHRWQEKNECEYCFASLPLDLILIWANTQTRGHGTYHGSVQYFCRYLDVSITAMQYNHSTQTRLRPHAGLKPRFGTSTLLRDTPPTPPSLTLLILFYRRGCCDI